MRRGHRSGHIRPQAMDLGMMFRLPLHKVIIPCGLGACQCALTGNWGGPWLCPQGGAGSFRDSAPGPIPGIRLLPPSSPPHGRTIFTTVAGDGRGVATKQACSR
jgi:hypothetical protein